MFFEYFWIFASNNEYTMRDSNSDEPHLKRSELFAMNDEAIT